MAGGGGGEAYSRFKKGRIFQISADRRGAYSQRGRLFEGGGG